MSFEPGITLTLQNICEGENAGGCSSERMNSLSRSLQSDVNQTMLDFWEKLQDEDGLARKSALHPANLPVRCLPHLILMDVQHSPMDFRYRLIGGWAQRQMRGQLTGKWFSEIPHKAAPSRLHSAFSKVVRSRLPRSTRVPYVGPHSSFLEIEDLVMPLASDTGRIDFLLISLDCFDPKHD